MKYVIINLETKKYLSTFSNFAGTIYKLEWTEYEYNAFQMHFDQANQIFDYITKHFSNLKIEVREL